METIYLDNNATTRVDPAVLETMLPFFGERYGNASSIHSFGGSVMHEIEAARRQVAELLGASFRDKDNCATEIIFTAGGTESDNAAINAAVNARADRKKIISTRVEHPAILTTLREYERRGFEIVLIPVDRQGRLDLDFAAKALDANTALVTVMWANNEIGNIYPVHELAEMAHRAGALFHTDAVQSVGKVPVKLDGSAIDLLSLSGHKLHGPKGIGVLFVRRGVRYKPFITGGHQERGRRGGTENAPGIIGLGKACELAKRELVTEIPALTALRDRLEKELLARIPHSQLNGDLESRLPNTSSISFEGIEGEAILSLLNCYGICASSGSACTTGSLEPSHVLRAMGIPYTFAHGTIRFSFSKFNTASDVDKVVKVLPGIVETLRKMSPYWQERK